METITTIINIIVALTTVATLVVIWCTLGEMKLQREKSYEPNLLPLNFKLLYLCKFPNPKLPIHSYENIRSIEEEKTSDKNYIKIANIGQGVAKDISLMINWNIEYEKYLRYLKDELHKHGVNIKMDVGGQSCWVSIDEEQKILRGGNLPFEYIKETSFDFLLPISSFDDVLKIALPSSLDIVLELSVLLFEVSDRDEIMHFFDKLQKSFNPTLKLSYKDNLDNSFSSEFNLKIETINEQIRGEIRGHIYTIEIVRERGLAATKRFVARR